MNQEIVFISLHKFYGLSKVRLPFRLLGVRLNFVVLQTGSLDVIQIYTVPERAFIFLFFFHYIAKGVRTNELDSIMYIWRKNEIWILICSIMRQNLDCCMCIWKLMFSATSRYFLRPIFTQRFKEKNPQIATPGTEPAFGFSSDSKRRGVYFHHQL